MTGGHIRRRRSLRARARLAHLLLRREAARAYIGPVLTLATGTAAAQALVFLARPVLTRLFDPEAFGVLSVFVAMAALATAITAWRYEDALMLPRRRSAAANVCVLALLLTLLASVLALVVIPLADPLAAVFGGNEMRPAILWLPAAILFLGSMLVLESWHTRNHRYRLLSASRAAQSVVAVAVQLIGGLMAASAAVLVLGSVVGFALGAVMLAAGAVALDGTMKRALSFRWMRMLGRRYARFPRYSAPASFLNALTGRAPVLILAILFSKDVVGWFGVAYGALALPIGLATGAIGQVFFVRAAEAQREGTLPRLTKQVVTQLLVVSAYPAAVVAVAGPLLFGFVFGGEWVEAGIYARALAPWLLLASVAPPLTRLFDILERQRADLAFSIVHFGVLGAAIVGAGMLASPLVTIVTLSAAGCVMRLLHVIWMLRLARVPAGPVASRAISVLAAAVPGVALTFAAQQLTGSGAVTLAAAAAGALPYLVLCRRFRPAGAKR